MGSQIFHSPPGVGGGHGTAGRSDVVLLAGGMAHNFNNNLSIILGNLELSKLKLPANPEIGRQAAEENRDEIQEILKRPLGPIARAVIPQGVGS